jgi:hypothetical protein
MSTDRRRFLSIITITLALLLSLACSITLQGDQQEDVALTAMSESIPKTLTAAAGEDEATGGDLATAQAEATEKSQIIQATQTADASTHDESQLATATVAAPVVAELPRYGIDPELGHLGFVHDPVTVNVEGYHQYGFANDFMQTIARDFVMAADITWDTQYGASGCGFMFRSNGDQNDPDQYLIIATRFGNGHVIFTAVVDGELANVQDFFPKTEDKSFDWQNGSTNRLVVVGKGTIFTLYTNGVKIGEVDASQPPPPMVIPPVPKAPVDQTNANLMQDYQNKLKEYREMVDQMKSNYQIALGNFETKDAVFLEGFVGFVALSESGRTVCQFDDAWLWHLEP